jgi:hypothetical protein
MAKASDVLTFLKEIGYETTTADSDLVSSLLTSVSSTIMNQCNISELPTDLDNVVVMRTCGAFFRLKSATSDLTTVFDVPSSLKKIVEGDVTVELSLPDSVSPQKLISDYIKTLEEYGKRDIAAFRKVRW